MTLYVCSGTGTDKGVDSDNCSRDGRDCRGILETEFEFEFEFEFKLEFELVFVGEFGGRTTAGATNLCFLN